MPTYAGRFFAFICSGAGSMPRLFDLDLLAEASDGFSGAGIEQAVVSALYAARADAGGATTGLTTQQVFAEIEGTQPLSVVMDRQIAALRAWASGRTVMA